jgi:tetratricopeptide (TPR) repeat protein
MKKFRIKFYAVITFLFLWVSASAQVDSPFNVVGPEASIDRILAENVLYPGEGLKNRMKGEVLFSVKIDQEGNFDSLLILESTHPLFEKASLEAVAYLKSNWYPELLESKSRDRRYLIFFNFDTFLNEKSPSDLKEYSENLIKKEKYHKALKVLNKLIAIVPYSAEALDLRWEVYRNLKEKENAQKDYLKAKYLKREFLAVVEVYAIGQTRRPVPISN